MSTINNQKLNTKPCFDYAEQFEADTIKTFNDRLTEQYDLTKTISGWRTKIINSQDHTIRNNPYAHALIKKIPWYRANKEIKELKRLSSICDGIEVDTTRNILSLYEIKCHRCLDSRSELGELLHRIRIDNCSIRDQWDALELTGLPYCIYTGFHYLNSQEIEADSLNYDDMHIVCFIGKGDKFTILQSDLRSFDWSFSADVINRMLENCLTYSKKEIIDLAYNAPEDYFWAMNQAVLSAEINKLSYFKSEHRKQTVDVQPTSKPTVKLDLEAKFTQSIEDMPNYQQRISELYRQGKDSGQIANELKKLGYTATNDEQLTTADISKLLPPRLTKSYDFLKHEKELKIVFNNALKAGASTNDARLNATDVTHLSDFLFSLFKKRYKETSVRRWLYNHYQSDFLVKLRKKAIKDYLQSLKGDTMLIFDTDTTQDNQIELMQQRINELEQTVHLILDYVRKNQA